ncbi:MAG TPA: hypothetical protein ENN09_01445, partial [Planctomycetes bacterium]|nr:hypothetical protein [Planctomycetota bacterium]
MKTQPERENTTTSGMLGVLPLRRTMPYLEPHRAGEISGGACVRRAALVLAFFAMTLAAPATAGDQPPDAAWRQLEEISRLAPARQVGQPGNDAVDRLVQERFRRAVERRNNPADVEMAEALLQEAEAAANRLAEARVRRQLITAVGDTAQSGTLVKYTLETPGITVFLIVMMGAMLVAGWWVQRRKSLLVAAAAMLVLAVALPIVAALVKTEAEAARSEDAEGTRSADKFTEIVDGLAREALAADLKAAAALRGMWQHGRITHPTAVFLPGETWLEGNGGRVRLYQLAPNLVEPGNLPEDGFSGRLLYAGMALPSDLAGKTFTESAVLLDFDSGNRWLDAVQLGAEVVIIVEPPHGHVGAFGEAARKLTVSPITVPRFFIRSADIETAFGQDWRDVLAAGGDVRITQQPGRWERRVVASDWLFIPGTAAPGDPKAPLQEDVSRQLVHIQAYKDSASIAPELSPGAVGAANLVLLLRLVEQFERTPPLRPVLVTAVNDHANALYGEQVAAFAYFADPKGVLVEMERLERELALQKFTADAYARTVDQEYIVRLRGWMEFIGGRNFTVKEPVQEHLTHMRNVAREERTRLQFRLEEDRKRHAAGKQTLFTLEETEKIREAITRHDRDVERFVKLMSLFNRIGTKTNLADLNAEERLELDALFAAARDAAAAEAAEIERSLETLRSNLSVRRRLACLTGTLDAPHDTAKLAETTSRRYAPLPAAALFSLDLSFGTDRVGFFYMGYLPRWGRHFGNADARSTRLASYSLRVANNYAKASGQENLLSDTILKAGGVPWNGYLGARFAFGGVMAHQYDVTGFTLASVHDMRALAFTPFDTIAHIDRSRFGKVMRFVEGCLRAIVDSEELGNTISSRGSPETFSIEVTVRKQDKFSVKVPKTRAAGALFIAAVPGADPGLDVHMLGEVRPHVTLITDVRGAAVLRGTFMNRTSVLAYEYDGDFRRITGAPDFGVGERRFQSTLSFPTGTQYETRNVVVFSAEKVDLVGLSDPLTLRPVRAVDVIDARQDSQPRHFSTAGVPAVAVTKAVPLSRDGTGCIFIESDSSFKLRVGAGLVINANPDHPHG